MTERAPDVTALLPFATSIESRGLGLGLAALVRVLAEAAGTKTALAQVFRENTEGKLESQELELDTAALGQMTTRGDVPPAVTHVLTGRIDAPGADAGYVRFSMLDVMSGRRALTIESTFDDEDAGRIVAEALARVSRECTLHLADTSPIAPLSWTSLGELLNAERCLVPSPNDTRAADVNAALVHLERAIAEAGTSPSLPSQRLASVIRQTELEPTPPRWLDAAARSVQRARIDAPDDMELAEAAAQLGLARGEPNEARSALASLPEDPTRVWTAVLRARLEATAGGLHGAIVILDAALAHAPTNPVLLTERARCLAATQREAEAIAVLENLLGAFPCFPGAFVTRADLATLAHDSATASRLVDSALAADGAPPSVTQAALALVDTFEPAGVARGSRRLRLLDAARVGGHPPLAWRVIAAQAHAECGDEKRALRVLDEAREKCDSAADFELVTRARLALQAPAMLLAADSTKRAAEGGAVSDLRAILERSERLGRETDYAPFFRAAAVAAERLGDPVRARALLDRAARLHTRTSTK